ncbi:hypothetical protein KUTeg_006820 [Tegillarca granosa]|uniref:Dolichyl-diphosphooligosaccharide-protein glycosyltransferase subunit TMEM258 n=1 Tax=Tegillarca granosa TaxID=220873 RepID=A0ABQ9FG64_TEGGR|nr:hypothetical protein KUTeg_006820 [Tegillarca granosa]
MQFVIFSNVTYLNVTYSNVTNSYTPLGNIKETTDKHNKKSENTLCIASLEQIQCIGNIVLSHGGIREASLTLPNEYRGFFIHAKLFIIIHTLDMESMSRYVSPINPAVFPHLTVVLLGIGIFFMAWFFVYEVTSNKFTRDIFKELLVSLVASVFMGFGVLFLLLWVGIYMKWMG